MNLPLNPNPNVNIPVASSAILRELKKAEDDKQMDIEDILEASEQ
jgi:hypothetical protein